VETLADKIRKPFVASMPLETRASELGTIAYLHFDEASSREILTVLDPETLEKIQVYPEEAITGFRWNKAGDRLAFLTASSTLGIYSPAERKILQIKKLTGYDLRWPGWPSQALEWTSDNRLVLGKLEGDVSYLCLLDANLTEQKVLRLPFSSDYPPRAWSAGNYAIVGNTEKHELWGADLTTDKWIRIY